MHQPVIDFIPFGQHAQSALENRNKIKWRGGGWERWVMIYTTFYHTVMMWQYS
jgi:hypothetical protein